MDFGSPAILRRWSSRCPRPASSRTTALRSRRVTWTPAGPGVFQVRDLRLQVRDLRLQVRDLFGELLLARRFGLRPERLRTGSRGTSAPGTRCSRSRAWPWPPSWSDRSRRGRTPRRPSSPHVYRIVRNAFIPVLIFRMNHIHRWIMKTRSLGHRYPLLSLSRLCMADTPRKSVLRGYGNSCHDNLTCHI